MTHAVALSSERWGSAWRHPLTLAGMAAAAGVAIVHFGTTARGFTSALLLAVLVALAVIDVERRILPNAIVIPAAAIVLAAQIAFRPDHTLEWIAAAVGASLLLLILLLVNRAGMGMGDVKLAFLLGAGLGAQVLGALLIASVAAWPLALYLLIRRGRDARKTAIPFGPFLALGAFLVLLGSAA
jgi:leader peptidase (prepilin peptidase)/N-methyltransferase